VGVKRLLKEKRALKKESENSFSPFSHCLFISQRDGCASFFPPSARSAKNVKCLLTESSLTDFFFFQASLGADGKACCTIKNSAPEDQPKAKVFKSFFLNDSQCQKRGCLVLLQRS
jgi:hypothetical protein